MRKWFVGLCAVFLFAPFASAQFTNVTALVVDPSGSPYVGCHANASFVPSPTATTQPLINGSVFPTSTVLAQCDSFGNAAWTLVDNNQVSDGHTGGQASQWRFSITSQDGKTSFFCTLTITGANQNISSAVQSCAAPLPPSGGGGGNLVVKSVPCASSMTFTMAGVSPNTSNTAFFINPLNCNVTSSTVAPPTGGTLQQGAIAQFTLVQPASGGFSLTWPSNFVDQPTIQAGPNATTNASFWYDGTKWHAQTFPAAGGGGGSPVGAQGTLQSTNGTTFSASNLSEPPSGNLAGSLKIGEDLASCGPNLVVDIRCYGARAVNPNTIPAAVGLTAACTATQTTCTISSASTFVNGDGVIIYGAGAAQSMSTPAAPTVTPSVAVGPVNTLTNFSSPAGSTTYNYYLMARDRNGGTTTLSPIGSTTTGQASLGPQTVNITSMSRSGQTVTVTTASAHGFNTGCNSGSCGSVYIGTGNSLSDVTFAGSYLVTSASNTTTFTVVGPPSTALGASASSTGGTATWYNLNKVAFTNVTGSVYNAIYSDRQVSGTCALIGVSNPTGTGSDTEFDDWGQTYEANQVFPAIFPISFPCSSPPTATSDSLSTTIASGAGTTTLTLANAAGTTVTGATIRLDATPAILAAQAAINAAGGGGSLYIPVDPNSNQFVVNSWVLLNNGVNGNTVAVVQTGSLYLNDTIEIANPSGQNSIKWIGDVLPQHNSEANSASWGTVPSINVNAAHPGLFFSGSPGGTHLSHVRIQGVPLNGSLGVLHEAGQNITFDWVDCGPGSGNNDFLSSCFMFRSNPANNDPGNIVLDFVGLSPGGGQSPDFGGSNSPMINCRQCANVDLKHAYFVHRGMYYGSRSGALQAGVGGVAYINGGGTPLVTVTNAVNSNGASVIIGQTVLDTVAQPCVANYQQGGGLNSIQFLNGVCGPSSGVLPVTGAYSSIIANAGVLPSTFVKSMSVSAANEASFNSFIQQSLNGGGFVDPTSSFFVRANPPTAPTCSVSSGGAVATGAYQFAIAYVWQNQVGPPGAFGQNGDVPGPQSTVCTTTSGQQTITVTRTDSSPAGLKGWVLYTNGVGSSAPPDVPGTVPMFLPSTTSAVVSHAFGAFLGPTQGIPFTGGPTMLMQGTQGLVGPQWTLASSNGFAAVHTGAFTASRSITWGDQSGTPAVAATSPITLSAAGTVACANCFNLSTSNNIGANFYDIGTRASPGNPASGNIRLYADSTSGNLTCLTSAGANCIPGSGSGTPGGSSTQVQYNSAGSFAGNANLTFVSPALSIGSTSGATGQIKYLGTTSGTVTTQSQDAAGTWTFKWPNSAGTSGFPMVTDGTGVGSWSLLGYAGGGTNQTTFTANQLVASGASSLSSLAGTTTGTNPIVKLQPSSASATALTLDTAASPSGDIQDVNVNGTKTSWFDSSAFLHTPQTTYTGSGPLNLAGTEGTCPSTVAGSDTICLGDATTHMAQLSDNGGSLKPIAQFSNASPAVHGVGVAAVTAPQINFTAAGTTGWPLLGQGNTADPIFAQVALNGANIGVTGILQATNGGIGASSISAANIITVTGAVTVGHCASFNASTVIQDSGGTCGGAGGSPPLHTITAATASNTINSTTNPQTWNWALTGSTTAFKFGENTAATGSNNILLQATTASSSTAVPFQTDNNGNGYQLSSTGLWKPVGTGSVAITGTAHGVVINQGSGAATTLAPEVAAGKVLIDNGPGNDPSFQDPVVSQAFVNLFNVASATATQTSSAVRNPIFSQTGTIEITWASISGSPSGCTLQFRGVDSLGNVLNNGSAVSVSPANGTTSQIFTASSTLLTAAQISVVYSCSTYPTAGTLSLDYSPIQTVTVSNLPATQPVSGTVSITSNSSVNVNQVGGSAVVADPCQQSARSSANISQTAGAQIITGTSGKQTYVCSMDLITATAQNIALVEGTGTTCGTGTAGMAGGSTAATGWNLAANGGLVKGTGGNWVFKTATAGDNVCILQSGSGQISGSIQNVQQ